LGWRVYRVAQFFAGLEEGHALGWTIDLFAGLGVAADAGVALAGAEACRSADFNLVADCKAPITDSKRVSTMISPSRR